MRFLFSVIFILGIIFVSNENLNQPQQKSFIETPKKESNYILVLKNNILIGDSQTPFIAKWSINATLLNKVGSESSLWKGGMGLNWLKTAITNYKLDTLIQSVTFCIGTNGRFSSKDDIIGLVNITKERSPNAYLYVIQGSWGWGHVKKHNSSSVLKYYQKFKEFDCKIIEPSIGYGDPHRDKKTYKTIIKKIESLINKNNE